MNRRDILVIVKIPLTVGCQWYLFCYKEKDGVKRVV